MILQADQLVGPWKAKNLGYPKNFVASDASYFCPTRELVANEIYPNFRKWLNSLNLGKWYHKWDCDNFSDAFKVFADGYYFNYIESDAESIAIGLVHFVAERRAESGTSGPHAGNIMYLDNKNNGIDIMYIEPQNGNIYNLTDQEFQSIRFIYV